jgi:hypothetical protein
MAQVQIYIEPKKGKAKPITLQVELSEKIITVKSKIKDKKQTPVKQQSLFLKNWRFWGPSFKVLSNWKSLEEYMIKEGSTIYIDTERITEGDKVSMKSSCINFRGTKTGKVIRDDGTSNPYIVEWDDNGEESDWLEPDKLKKASEVSTEMSTLLCFFHSLSLSLSLALSRSLARSLYAMCVLYSKDSANMLTVFLLSIKASENAEVSTHCWPARICSGQQSVQIKIRWRDQDVRPGTQLEGKAKIGKAKIILLQVELTDDIDEVKSKIEELDKEISALNQCLFLGDVELEGSKKLDDYHIKTGSCIEIEIKKLFGMKWVDVGTQVPPNSRDITPFSPEISHGPSVQQCRKLAALLNTKVNRDFCLTVSQRDPPAYKAETMNYLIFGNETEEEEGDGENRQHYHCYVQYRKNVASDILDSQIKVDFGSTARVEDNRGSDEDSVQYVKNRSKEGTVSEKGTRISIDNRFIDLAYDESVMILKNALGLKWIHVGSTKPEGQELKNDFLAKVLWEKRTAKVWSTVTLKPEELPEIKELRLTHFVKADVEKVRLNRFRKRASFFKPAEEEWLSQNDCIKAANGRYDAIIT